MPAPVSSCAAQPSAGATSTSPPNPSAPAVGRPLSRSTISARSARLRRHSHRILISNSSVTPLDRGARAPGRALSSTQTRCGRRRGSSASAASALGLRATFTLPDLSVRKRNDFPLGELRECLDWPCDQQLGPSPNGRRASARDAMSLGEQSSDLQRQQLGRSSAATRRVRRATGESRSTL